MKRHAQILHFTLMWLSFGGSMTINFSVVPILISIVVILSACSDAANNSTDNTAPVIVADSLTTAEDVPVIFANPAGNDIDVDNDVLTITDITQPEYGSLVENNDGSYTYTPTTNFNGSDKFMYTVSDGHGGEASGAVQINVTPVNDPPSALNDSINIDEDSDAVVIDVLANDTDPEDQAFSIDTQNAASSIAANGLVNYNNNGTFSYKPDSDFSGDDSFNYAVKDAEGGVSFATVTIHVAPKPDAPKITSIAQTKATQDVEYRYNVQINDPDIGDIHSFSITTTPNNTRITIDSSTGSIHWKPENADVGDYQVNVTVTDQDGLSDQQNFILSVANTNDLPVLSINSPLTVAEGGNGNISNQLLKTLDIDNNASQLTYKIISTPINGELLLNNYVVAVNSTFTQADIDNNNLTYAHNGSETTSDNFIFSLNDSSGGEIGDTTFNINITPVNDTPIAVADTVSVKRNSNLILAAAELLSNDTDAENDQLTIKSVSGADKGTVTLDTNNNTISYTPQVNSSGSDSFTYIITDNKGGVSAPATVTIDMEPGWGKALEVYSSTEWVSSPLVVVDDKDNVTMMWEQQDSTKPVYSGYNTDIWVRRYENQTWLPAEKLAKNDVIYKTPIRNTSEARSLCFDASGSIIAVWDQFDGTQWHLWSNRFQMGKWLGSNLIGGLQFVISSRCKDNKIAIFTETNSIPRYFGGYVYSSDIEWKSMSDITYPNYNVEKEETFINVNGDPSIIFSDYYGSTGGSLGYYANTIWATYYANGKWNNLVNLDLLPVDSEYQYYGDVILSSRRPVTVEDKNGNITAVWERSDNVSDYTWTYYLWFSRYDVSTSSWGTPKKFSINGIDQNHSTNCRLVVDQKGNVTAVWTEIDAITNYSNLWSARYEPAFKDWVGITKIETQDFGGVREFKTVIDENGNVTVVWTQYDGTKWDYWFNRYESGKWKGASVLVSGESGINNVLVDVKQLSSGDISVVWRQYDTTTSSIYETRYKAGKWITPEKIFAIDVVPKRFAGLKLIESDSGNLTAVLSDEYVDANGNHTYKFWHNDFR